ncbi:MAG: type II toxin-antitoxin system VapC family toxin [Gammaproteobacteria bacterium]
MIVLDTHAWIWWLSDPEQLSDPARQHLEQALSAAAPVYVSTISSWEVAMLVRKKRLELTIDVEDWIAHAEAIEVIEFVPVSNHLALRSIQLPGQFHADPADRLIVATARYLGLPLVTRDSKMHDYPNVETIW